MVRNFVIWSGKNIGEDIFALGLLSKTDLDPEFPHFPLPLRETRRRVVIYLHSLFATVLYDQYFIDDLRERADLVRLIEPYAPLKKKGANWMGNCPFHQEKTPSFSVNPAKGFYKCFGCGKGGNAFTFVMEMEGLNFPEAVRRIAEMNGVPLPEPIDDGQYTARKQQKEEQKKLSEQVIELNRLALEFWEKELQGKNAKAAAAREYLSQRGISEDVQKQFRIGFAPDSWDALLTHLKTSGADEKLIEQSGLVSVNEEKERVFDRFRNRIIFPVLDVNGAPVAFGARAMGDDQPKYLNSPETPAYVKGQHLYGLFNSRDAIRQKKFVILVEGYLDLIALYQFGVTNVAASLGTAFTPEQAKLLGRFTKRVVINYDGDPAGIKAARRAIEQLLPQDLEIKVLVLPGGQDPDDFIRANGTDGYNDARGKALPFLNFSLESSMSERNFSNPKQRAEAIEEVIPVIAAIKNPIQKRQSFDDAMVFYRVDDDGIKRDLWHTVKNGRSAETGTIKQQVSRVARARLTVAEQQLLELVVYDTELREKVLEILEEPDHENLATAEIFRAMYIAAENGHDLTAEFLLNAAGDDPVLQDLVPLLMMVEPKRAEGEVIDEVFHQAENCILTLRSMAITNRISDIARELAAAEQAGDGALASQLVAEQLDLARMKHTLLTKIKEI
ncbi:MAG: DNA primase [Acidobacteria bacterium]|nr:DNA primase [Acidobacteriota bacterium]